MAFRSGDLRHTFRVEERCQGPNAKATQKDLDYSSSDRSKLGQKDSTRTVTNHSAKYFNLESDYTSRLPTANLLSKVKEDHEFKDTLGSISSQPDQRMCVQSVKDSFRLNAGNSVSVEDEEQFLYGSKLASVGFSKDYKHGQSNKSLIDEIPGISTAREASRSETETYDPTIENILKSIGFNVDLSLVMNESTKSELLTGKAGTSVSSNSESLLVSAETSATSSVGRIGSSKKVSNILSSHESYEERARRYREEQTRLYAEANSKCNLAKDVVSQQIPTLNGSNSLELLQSSYDYDKIISELGKDMAEREMQKKAVGSEGGDSNSKILNAKPVSPKKSSQPLYEDFSDSDDNMSDLDKTDKSESKKVSDDVKSFQIRKNRLGHDEDTKTVSQSEPYPRKSGVDANWSLDTENFFKSLKEPGETVLRHVHVFPSVTGTEDSVARNSGGCVQHISSKWDSPERIDINSGKHDGQTGSDLLSGRKKVTDPKISEKQKVKISSLNRELEKLKQKQRELMRQKQRGKYGHKDPELLENSRRMENINAEVDKLSKCTDEEFAKLEAQEHDKSPSKDKDCIVSTSENKKIRVPGKKTDNSSGVHEKVTPQTGNRVKSEQLDRPKLQKMIVKYDYFDDGDHWCRSCNSVFSTIKELCEHLQSNDHRQNMDLNHRPWATKDSLDKQGAKKSGGVPVPIKGVEFMMPTQAYYCSLCNVFAGDAQCAFEHLKSNEHNESYKRFIENDTFYERHYTLDKEAALSLINKRLLGVGAKRSSTVQQLDQTSKRTKLTSDVSLKPAGESGDSKTAPNSDSLPPETKSCGIKEAASKVSLAPLQKPVVLQKKPAFIGKLPCLKASAVKKPLARVGVSSAAAGAEADLKAKEVKGSRCTYASQMHLENSKEFLQQKEDAEEGFPKSAEARALPEASTSLTQPKTESDLTDLTKLSRNKPELTAIDEPSNISSAPLFLEMVAGEGGRETTSASAGRKNVNGTQKLSSVAENSSSSQMTEEVMFLGDFEVFDECDAE